jgi:hypothetical protein
MDSPGAFLRHAEEERLAGMLGDRYDNEGVYRDAVYCFQQAVQTYLNVFRLLRAQIDRTKEGEYLLPYASALIARIEDAFGEGGPRDGGSLAKGNAQEGSFSAPSAYQGCKTCQAVPDCPPNRLVSGETTLSV